MQSLSVFFAKTVRIVLSLALLTQFHGVTSAEDKDLPFKLVTIDANPPNRPWYKMVGDVTGDGFPDIVVGGSKGPLIAYIAPKWNKVQIGDGGWDGVNGEIADLDGDGDQDIVMGGLLWFENPGNMDRSWDSHLIEKRRLHDIEIADLDGDRRLDIVARDQSAFGKSGNTIHIYHQQDEMQWGRLVVDCPHGEGLELGDVDGDKDHDIIIGGLWYENPGDALGRWQPHQYTSKWTEPDAKVELADINGDGKQDIVLTPAELKEESYKVCWYEAPSGGQTDEWTEHVIIESIECVIHSLGVGDLDGDGDIDVAMAEMHQGQDPDEVVVLLNQGSGQTWHKQVLSDRGSHDIVVADIDSDGDLDIVGANHGGDAHPIELWQNGLDPFPRHSPQRGR